MLATPKVASLGKAPRIIMDICANKVLGIGMVAKRGLRNLRENSFELDPPCK